MGIQSHERLHLGRHSETPQTFSYYHAKLLFVLLSYSFHLTYKQCQHTCQCTSGATSKCN